jgi:hypothetical protein
MRAVCDRHDDVSAATGVDRKRFSRGRPWRYGVRYKEWWCSEQSSLLEVEEGNKWRP